MSQTGVRRDWVDLRDLYYTPSLTSLRATRLPDPRCIDPVSGPVFGLRDQRDARAPGRCVGYALANLIDMQRALQAETALGPVDQVSADMLYHMARFHDLYTSDVQGAAGSSGVRSLRSGIKGFYHHGVCLDLPKGCTLPSPDAADARWQSMCYRFGEALPEEDFPSVLQAKSAQQISLGAYYRLRPVLNHYHAALNEAGVVLVSTNLTSGWANPDGVIPAGSGAEPVNGAHAVALVGYDERGFLVLNSWGDWGGYRGYPGVALWQYSDWAENIMDGWVLRLGVPTPQAFDLTIGEQGASRIYGPIRAGSIPCRELLGHFLHLDDGHHVERGSYPSSPALVAKTLAHLDGRLGPDPDPEAADTRYRGVVVWITGSLEDMEDGFAAAIRRKKLLQDQGLFLITVFWCNDFFEQTMDVLGTIMQEARDLTGEGASHLDQVIETRANRIGRAFWRDIEHAAQRSVEGISEHPRNHVAPAEPGHVATLLKALTELSARHGSALHLVAEGAGALVLAEWLEAGPGTGANRLAQSLPEDARALRLAARRKTISSVQLALPAIDLPRAQEDLLPWLKLINAGTTHISRPLEIGAPAANASAPEHRTDAAPGPAPARVYIPDQMLEKRLRVGIYGKSILHLVAHSFEDRRGGRPDGAARTMLGMACAPDQIRCNAPDDHSALFTPITLAEGAELANGPVEQQVLTRHPELEAEMLATLLHHTPPLDLQD